MTLSKATVSILVLIAAAAFLVAEQPDETTQQGGTVTSLARIGQDAIFYPSTEAGLFTVRLYSKERKMQILALSQKYNELDEKRRELQKLQPENEANGEALDLQVREIEKLQRELRKQVNSVSLGKPSFHRVRRVGDDFIALERENLTTVILKGKIHVMYLEDVTEK